MGDQLGWRGLGGLTAWVYLVTKLCRLLPIRGVPHVQQTAYGEGGADVVHRLRSELRKTVCRRHACSTQYFMQ